MAERKADKGERREDKTPSILFTHKERGAGSAKNLWEVAERPT